MSLVLFWNSTHTELSISNPRQAIEHLLEGCIDVLYINGLKIRSKLGAKKLKGEINFINTEKSYLKKENLSWYHKNKLYLDKKSIKMFQSFLKKKF